MLPSFTQGNVGGGLPVALHINLTLLPSLTVLFPGFSSITGGPGLINRKTASLEPIYNIRIIYKLKLMEKCC